MFGPISPKVKDLTQHQNTWSKDQIYSAKRPTISGTIQASPYTIWEGQGWSTNTGASSPVAYRAFAQPVQGSPTFGRWRLQYSLNNSAYTDSLTYDPRGALFSTKPLFTIHSGALITVDNSSAVQDFLTLEVRSVGVRNHIGMSFSGTTRSAWSVDNTGYTEFKAGGSIPIFNFLIGSSITSQTLITQIFSGGINNQFGSFNAGRVTAGSNDQSTATTLSSYGSFALKGVLVTSSSYTLADETMVYVDPSQSNFCVGTPTACNTYLTEGNCNAHNAVGCSWFTGYNCNAANNTDSTTCTGLNAVCVWAQSSCSGADNTDQTTCENQNNAYGGTCTWDTSTCPSLTTAAACSAEPGCTAQNGGDCTAYAGQSQATCEALGGGGYCTWTGASCSTFNGTDQSTCESGHTGCTWFDDSGNCGSYGDQTACESAGCYWNGAFCGGKCNGVYNEASTCTGNYFDACTGNLCNGDFYNGNCTGTYGAQCQGTANCGNITNSPQCASEAGCSWQSGVIVTLPTTANALRGTTGRIYSIMHVGPTGTVSIVGQSGQPIFQYTTLNLLKKGDKVLLHNQNITFQCSLFTSQTPCQAQAGCSWLLACSTYGDQSSCEAAQCSWNGDTNVCEGRSSAACFGTYSNGSYWYAHSLERGLNYTEKTANYTLLDIDDVVNCTSNSFTITLPSAALMNGKRFVVKNTGSGTITMNTTSSQTIDGNASGVLTLTQGDSLEVVSNNSNWLIV